MNQLQENDPIFKGIFGQHWPQLPSVLRKHYTNRPFSNDKVVVEGQLDIKCRHILKLMAPFYRLLGSVPMVTASKVPVRVQFDSDKNSSAFHFNRTFLFEGKKPYQFKSRMLQLKDNEVIEIMKFGICWRMLYCWEDGKVKLKHKGYAQKVFSYYLPLPLTCLIGRGDAEESAVDDKSFAMKVSITHPLFGEIYSYAGQFRVVAAES